MTAKLVSASRPWRRTVLKTCIWLLGIVPASAPLSCSSSAGAGAKHCKSDADCGLAQGCDLDDPNDGYCSQLCRLDSECPVQQPCKPKVGAVYKSECDNQGDHADGQGICDQYDGKYGPESCQEAAIVTGSAGSGASSSGGSTSSASGGSTSSQAGSTNTGRGGSGASSSGSGGSGAMVDGGVSGGNGSGASAGTSSSGAGGSAADCPATCSDPTPGDPLRISGLESNTAAIDPVGGRNGGWYTIADSQGTSIYPAPSTTFAPYCGGAANSCYSACFAGSLTGTNYPYAYVGLTFHANNSAYDVTSYSGITFSVYGSVGAHEKLELKVPTLAVIPSSAGGTCKGVCYDDYNIDLTGFSKTAIATYDVPFAKLTQDGFGTVAPWVPTTVTGLEWHVTSKVASVTNEQFVICIDEVRFSGISEGGIIN